MRNPKFLGVYSRLKSNNARAKKQLNYVWELDRNTYAIQAINEAFMAVSKPELITAAHLQGNFRLEPSILAAPLTTPDFRALHQPKHGEAAELTDAFLEDLERARKAKQIENDLRSNFTKALRALNRPKDRKGAIAAIEHIVNSTEGIVPAHRHMFRDFGVSLRKKSQPELALLCAKRALELSPNDDHAHFNMARILDLLGLDDQAVAHLRAAMKIDSGVQVYKKFLDYIQERRLA